MKIQVLRFSIAIFSIAAIGSGCGNSRSKPRESELVQTPQQINAAIQENITALLDFATDRDAVVLDSSRLDNQQLVKEFYSRHGNTAAWSSEEKWLQAADSMLWFIRKAKYYGLFPEDYHGTLLENIAQRFALDSSAKKDRRDAVLWAKADIALTDAFFHLVRDIKLGRLPNDSVSLRKDSVLTTEFYIERLGLVKKRNSTALVFNALEPRHAGYHALKNALPAFLDSASDQPFIIVPPASAGLAAHRAALQKRLTDAGFLVPDSVAVDSVTLAAGVKKFQQSKGITVDGKAGEGTLRMLNLSDAEKFLRVAVTMDRYKLLPEVMPDRYVWVNIPAFVMQFHQGDSINEVSRIIVGKPKTRTPLLNSAISELITYPQWTVPTSIIAKEILPAVKKDPGYLARKGFSLLDSKGDEVDPYSITWSKYSKGIPYRVVQGSGDANALGILKFNFPNKYAVYLHDTNQRYLFGQTMRSLSHGCVRVQEWEKLAYSIVRHDSRDKVGPKATAVEDSMRAWLVRKEKHSIPVRNKLPVYIRYFTCEARDGRLVIHDDIYGEDKFIIQRYFRPGAQSGKQIAAR